MASCDGVRPIAVRAGADHPEGVTYTPHEGSSQPPDTGHQPENWHRVSMFCYFGSLHQKLRVGGPPTGSVHRDGSFLLCIVTGALVCCGRCTCSLSTLRRHFLRAVAAAVFYVHVAAATSASCRGTSQQNIAFQMFLQLQTLRRHVSRPVAAGVSLSLKDVAASQYVCSRGADNLSSISLWFSSSGVTFALRVVDGSMVIVECIMVAHFGWTRFRFTWHQVSVLISPVGRAEPRPWHQTFCRVTSQRLHSRQQK